MPLGQYPYKQPRHDLASDFQHLSGSLVSSHRSPNETHHIRGTLGVLSEEAVMDHFIVVP